VRVIVTCGPSYEPIDAVRRITNFSTGELGILLANELVQNGHAVVCCKGVGATCPLPLQGARLVSFTTNDDLRAQLKVEADRGAIDALFHAAALCDYKVQQATGADGAALTSAKISSRQGVLTLVLEPLPKLIVELRKLFPDAKIVGWKYELDGGRDEAVAAGQRQMAEASSDACVVNGAAFGPGFGFCKRDEALIPFADKAELCRGLARWLAGTSTGGVRL